ncbi:MAG: NAD(P)H-binding protein [Bacteroidales bacterium]
MENKKYRALLVGASGLIGQELLNQLFADERFESVTVWVRKTLDISHSKLVQKVIDFDALPEKLEHSVDYAFCALGTTIKKAGSETAQHKIDYEYVVEFAKVCKRSEVASLGVVSSLGANAKASNFYLRTKGEMEESLKSLQLNRLVFVRPSLLLGNRQEFRLGEVLMTPLIKLFAPLLVGKLRKYRGVEASKVAACLIRESITSNSGVTIIESDKIGQSFFGSR